MESGYLPRSMTCPKSARTNWRRAAGRSSPVRVPASPGTGTKAPRYGCWRSETGLSRGAIFHHFRDKESLFIAVAEDDAAAMVATVAEHGLVQVMRDLLHADAGRGYRRMAGQPAGGVAPAAYRRGFRLALVGTVRCAGRGDPSAPAPPAGSRCAPRRRGHRHARPVPRTRLRRAGAASGHGPAGRRSRSRSSTWSRPRYGSPGTERGGARICRNRARHSARQGSRMYPWISDSPVALTCSPVPHAGSASPPRLASPPMARTWSSRPATRNASGPRSRPSPDPAVPPPESRWTTPTRTRRYA